MDKETRDFCDKCLADFSEVLQNQTPQDIALAQIEMDLITLQSSATLERLETGQRNEYNFQRRRLGYEPRFR